MNVFANLPRLFWLFFTAGAIALSPAAHAWDWNWGWGGNSVKGSGIVKNESRNIAGFSSISISIPARLTIVQGETEGVVLEGDDNILPLIETVVDDRQLQIRFKEKICR